MNNINRCHIWKDVPLSSRIPTGSGNKKKRISVGGSPVEGDGVVIQDWMSGVSASNTAMLSVNMQTKARNPVLQSSAFTTLIISLTGSIGVGPYPQESEEKSWKLLGCGVTFKLSCVPFDLSVKPVEDGFIWQLPDGHCCSPLLSWGGFPMPDGK